MTESGSELSNKAKVFVARRLPEKVQNRMERHFRLDVSAEDRDLNTDECIYRCRGVDALVVMPTTRLTAETIGRFDPQLRIICTYSAGHDHIDLSAARARGIIVTNTPDVLTDSTADVAMLCMLGAVRRVREVQHMLYSGCWRGWAPTDPLGYELNGARLGIVGMGRIGQAVAKRASSFGMRVQYWNRRPVAVHGGTKARHVPELDDLFRDSDVISLHVAAGPQTRHLVNARRLALLPKHAILVNTARGILVDDDALVSVLRERRIAGAGLDVFEGEPDIHPGYLALPNVFLLPHIGSATVEAREAMGYRVLANLAAFFSGDEPPDRLNDRDGFNP